MAMTREVPIGADEIYDALCELGRRIEACGASLPLTHAVCLCSDLRQALGNKWNRADSSAADRVRSSLTMLQGAHDADAPPSEAHSTLKSPDTSNRQSPAGRGEGEAVEPSFIVWYDRPGYAGKQAFVPVGDFTKLRQRLAEMTEKYRSISDDYQRIIKEVLACNPLPASSRTDDQLEPPWEVIARIRQRAEQAESRLRERDEELKAARQEIKDAARGAAAEASWKERQGGDYGSY